MCDKEILLQSTTGCYYKVLHVIQSVTDCYYNMREILQNMTVIKKWDVRERERERERERAVTQGTGYVVFYQELFSLTKEQYRGFAASLYAS